MSCSAFVIPIHVKFYNPRVSSERVETPHPNRQACYIPHRLIHHLSTFSNSPPYSSYFPYSPYSLAASLTLCSSSKTSLSLCARSPTAFSPFALCLASYLSLLLIILSTISPALTC